MTTKNKFAARLKQLRTDKGLSQRALGRAAKLSNATVCQLEADSDRSPKLSVIEKLALALGVRKEELIGT